MNANIFRKVSLERLSSPEQLDEAYRVTTPKEWVALVGVLLLVVSVLVWSFEGSVATTVGAPGVIIKRGGVMNVVASASGLVLEVAVKPGEHVTANQVVAKIAQPGLTERIRVTEAALADARRERTRNLRVRSNASKLQLEALGRQRANAEREIGELQAQSKLVAEQIPVDEQLLAKGLITKQQTLATTQKIIALDAQVAALRAQITGLDAQQFTVENDPTESDVGMQARLTELERSLAALQQELSTSASVISPYTGQVLELKVSRGSAVSEGLPVISMQPDVEALEVLVYLTSSRAKEVKVGVEAQVSPDTVRREEFGYLRGRVTFVAEYPATPAAVMRNLENESLAQSLTSGGPVTELRVELERAATPSGFRWSSRQGPSLQLSSGTLCSTLIVTRKQKPITLVLPIVQE